MSETVEATWVGTYRARLEDGTELIPGETVVEISAGEAEESEHWRPKAKGKKLPSKLKQLRAKADELGIDHSTAKSARAVQKLIDAAQTPAADSPADTKPAEGEGVS